MKIVVPDMIRDCHTGILINDERHHFPSGIPPRDQVLKILKKYPAPPAQGEI